MNTHKNPSKFILNWKIIFISIFLFTMLSNLHAGAENKIISDEKTAVSDTKEHKNFNLSISFPENRPGIKAKFKLEFHLFEWLTIKTCCNFCTNFEQSFYYFDIQTNAFCLEMNKV